MTCVPGLDTVPIILDNGSGHIKAGLAGEESPEVVIPACVGRPKQKKCFGDEEQSYFIGNHATEKRGILSIVYPISTGIVQDWDSMELIWRHTFYNELRIDPEKHAVVVTEAPLNPRRNRERMIEVLFDKFSCPAVYVVIQAVMTLYGSGKVTGCVVDSGDGVTHVVPIYEGYSCSHAIERVDVAGRNVTEHLFHILHTQGQRMESSSEKDIVREIKESLCYVAMDYKEECEKVKSDPEMTLEHPLPDGTIINLGTERFEPPEVLFRPDLIGREALGMHQLIEKSIKGCDIDLRRTFWENIVLSGGTTLYKGLPERLHYELSNLAPAGIKIKIDAKANRRYIVWKGASVVSELTAFPDLLIMKAEYDEHGSQVVHNKCF